MKSPAVQVVTGATGIVAKNAEFNAYPANVENMVSS